MSRALKNTVVLFITVAVTCCCVAAGTLEKGVKIGMSISNWRGNDVGISDYKVGFAAGGFATYLVHRNVGLQIEALYVTKGSVQESSVLDSGSVSISYIEIPLLFRVVMPVNPEKTKKPSYHATDKGFRPGFYAGPAVAICLTDQVEVGTATAKLKGTDIGVAFGGGFDVELGRGMLAFDARYTLGITDIIDSELDPDVRNGGVTLMLGYVFR